MNDSMTVQFRLVERRSVEVSSVQFAGGEFPSLRPGTYPRPRAADSPSPTESRDGMMPATRQGWAA